MLDHASIKKKKKKKRSQLYILNKQALSDKSLSLLHLGCMAVLRTKCSAQQSTNQVITDILLKGNQATPNGKCSIDIAFISNPLTVGVTSGLFD